MTPGQAALPVAALEAAAAAIMTAQNANDDQPERWEAAHLAKVALEAALPLLAAQESHAEPELAEVFRELALELDAEADNLGGGVGFVTRHEVAERIRRRLGTKAEPQPAPELAQLREQLAIAAGALRDIGLSDDAFARDQASRALDDIGGVKPCAPGEVEQLREQLELTREQLGNLAAGLELSASASAPSKKSEIERSCAAAVRGIASPPS